MKRQASLEKILSAEAFDIAVIGGGATGVGVALDAASRGFSVALLEQADFGKGTSSRSTKLIHGGVRYLQQGNLSLVTEALRERGLLRQNAPHLVHDLPFIVPNYAWWETPFYGVGLRVYDMLAGKYNFARSRVLSKAEVLAHIPTLERDGLRGGVMYHDGQFDDARLLIDMAHTATGLGATLLNYAEVTGLAKEAGVVAGVEFRNVLGGAAHTLRAKCVINATGAFSDAVRRLDDPRAKSMIAPSQGVHIVLGRDFLPGDAAIMVPHTADKRVMFAIPFLGHTLVGTTDTAIQEATLEPTAQQSEIDFLLATAGKYLAKRPRREDVLSVFTGIRPLFRASAERTASLARDHVLMVSESGLLTIVGGKWTTTRKMAEDAVDHAIPLAGLEEWASATKTLRIANPSDAGVHAIQETETRMAERILPGLPYTWAHMTYAVREEMAMRVEDVLSRRTRCLILNARAAVGLSREVAVMMARELGRDEAWVKREVEEFREMASRYEP